ncbi:DUF6264 family protein [Microbacterium sp. CFBP9034]|uniref:DUF6264 family protein n=1 Tax=Microbacterium sp. CFBP9034 TaxID=3096540 RepID=UPI002A6B26E4|nr:DUF6264 family protein [Microbacterium sp. CFBP9034]MDY0911082.1 DUF6264 family protein [Microbacterium sp. CFBP9034]
MTEAATPSPNASPDPRPRPQYGEYASPEEQQARIRQPDVTWALETGQASPAEAPAVAPTAVAPPLGAAPATPDASARPQRSRAIDRIVTFALLAYGLVNVISAFPAMVDYVAYTDTMFEILGLDVELSDPSGGRPWGIAAALVLAFGWLLTALLAWVNLRRGRLSWWIPLVGGIVFTFVAAMLILVPIMNDPAVWDALVGTVR